MQHPDEGTIHAWLDGALDEAEAARVAEHVATCPECESRVVEARGLIAGASRVLSALDAVPAGVIPPAPVATPDENAPERDRPVHDTRHWWRRRGVTPALAAAAAVVFVAVGSSLVLRERSPMAERVMISAAPAPSDAPAATDTTPTMAKSAAAAAPRSESTAAPAPSTPSAVAEVPAAGSAEATAPGAGLAAPRVVPTVVAPHRETELRAPVQGNVAASEQRAAAPSVEGGVAAAAPRARAAERMPAPAPPPSASAEAQPRAAIADLAARKPARPSADSMERLNRMRSMPMQLSEVVVTGVGSSREDANAPERALRGSAQRSAPAAAADSLGARQAYVGGVALAGCYEIVDGETGFVPRRFVLDTAVATTIVTDSTGAQAYAPLAAMRKLRGVDGEPVVIGWWRALGAIARVEWERDGSRAVLEIRPGAGARFATSLAVDGTSRPVTLRRCTE